MKANGNQAVTTWLQAYHESVGSPADECLQLYHSLRNGQLADTKYLTLLHELLEILSGLSPDPHTVSCAILFVASECEQDLGSLRADLSSEVR